ERGEDLLHLGLVEQTGPAEPAHVGAAAGDVVGEEALVVGQAHRVGEQHLGGTALEAAVPQRAHEAPSPWSPASVEAGVPSKPSTGEPGPSTDTSAAAGPRLPARRYTPILARLSSMSRLRMVSWPMRSSGPNALSLRSIDR